MHHWTDHNIRVHVFTCVLALQLARLMRYRARQEGLDLSVRELLGQLGGIEETVLVYPSTGGRPKARRMTTELTGHQPGLYHIFGLARWAPKSQVIRRNQSQRAAEQRKPLPGSKIIGKSG